MSVIVNVGFVSGSVGSQWMSRMKIVSVWGT